MVLTELLTRAAFNSSLAFCC